MQFDHFVHHVVDISCRDLKIRFVTESCVGAFEEMESRSFFYCCSVKDLVDIGEVETEEGKAFVEVVAAIPEAGDGL